MGNIKVIAAILLITSLLSVSANAARWIIKNPKNENVEALLRMNSHSYLQLENKYLMIDTNERMSAFQLQRMFDSESAFEDMQIVIDQPANDKEVVSTKGWHVDALEYANLNSEYNGQGITVAVLDTGVDYRHINLEEKMWKNTNEIPDNNIDDDNNGYIDDYHGWNFDANDKDPMDGGSHGTHCSGIIAASKNKDTNAQGVAQGVKIMPLLIIGDDSFGFLGNAARAVKYATDHGAKVLSNSWRVYQSWNSFMNVEGLKMLEEAIAYAGSRGVIFVAAAGNETRNLDTYNLQDPIYPLALQGLPNMIGVASSALIGTEENISSFSNYGVKSVVVSAPGSFIFSTTPYGQWAMMSGTSMATPIVAGTLARGLSKGYTMEEALDKLNQTSKKTNYWEQFITFGRIDIKKYLD